ncbi:probable RNA methyltransferase CG1239 [Bradysia coprophila]|uniref:probable RNA methyltransferase CG1239 n=1 Tax=Bradysia coprophila TaxID=38358 RepID=UPI00187D8D2B|nr:probable RNA methyltransferase CG1239 [Bradysia coprophila]
MEDCLELKVKQVDSTTNRLTDQNPEQNSEISATDTAAEITLKRPLSTTKTTYRPTSINPNSPKKQRLDMPVATVNSMQKKRGTSFIHGNYDRYYGYRNSADFKDIRLETFEKHRNFFEGKNVLDVGCNNGLVTISVARDLHVKHIVGVEIDRRLVDKARTLLTNEKRNSTADGESFPFNVEFKSGNYVLANEKLLEMEVEQFDTILCLSVTKWIHLNCGDDGLKLTFRRMYKQLLPGGRLILEAQDWKSYKRRKNLTPNIAANYKNIRLLPDAFDQYLLSEEVGFQNRFTINVAQHNAKGFQRPIKVFVK